jgi:ribosomal protein L37E
MTTGENTGIKCTQCGNQSLDEGFVEDSGQSSRGFAKWVAGPLERGPFGGAKLMGKSRLAISAFRCQRCGHLELFASGQ